MKGLSIGTMLTSVLMTFAGKIIAAFGIGFVSYAGIDYMQAKFASWISQQLGNFPADAMQIFFIAGGGVFLNWIFGDCLYCQHKSHIAPNRHHEKIVRKYYALFNHRQARQRKNATHDKHVNEAQGFKRSTAIH